MHTYLHARTCIIRVGDMSGWHDVYTRLMCLMYTRHDSCVSCMRAHVSYEHMYHTSGWHDVYMRHVTHGVSPLLAFVDHVAYTWVMSRTNESCHTRSVTINCIRVWWLPASMPAAAPVWMSHVAYEWVMLHSDESWLIRTSHVECTWVSYEWVMAHIKKSWLIDRLDSAGQVPRQLKCHAYSHPWQMLHTCEWVMSRMRDVTHGDSAEGVSRKECHDYSIHCTQMNESCSVTMTRSIAHIWMSHVSYEWIMSHPNESCHTRRFGRGNMWITRMCGRCCAPINESCRVCMSHVTHEHNSFIRAQHLPHIFIRMHVSMSLVAYVLVMSHMNELYATRQFCRRSL